jgi:hypothetical protein
MPGAGCFDLARALRTLDRIGGLRSVGPEVLSPLTAAMPAVEAAQVAIDATRELIARSRTR